jgi:hypothetical protein
VLMSKPLSMMSLMLCDSESQPPPKFLSSTSMSFVAEMCRRSLVSSCHPHVFVFSLISLLISSILFKATKYTFVKRKSRVVYLKYLQKSLSIKN